jgi:hypothetical protein
MRTARRLIAIAAAIPFAAGLSVAVASSSASAAPDAPQANCIGDSAVITSGGIGTSHYDYVAVLSKVPDFVGTPSYSASLTAGLASTDCGPLFGPG